MSRQKNALANLSAVMQKLVQSESETETISLQPNWFLERAELNLPSFPHQQLSFHFHVEARKWLHEEEQWWSALASERNGPLETVCAGQGPGAFQVQDLSSPRGVAQPCLFLLATTCGMHPVLSPRGTHLSFAVQRFYWASVTETWSRSQAGTSG